MGCQFCAPKFNNPYFDGKERRQGLFDMAKIICSELEGGSRLDLMGLVMAVVIALILMVICAPPPRRYIAYRVA
ncbi:hypothetical protein OWV82_000676 [Melia azedarach]|uniref:Uncharacterized protein n=1 Tax=Melia azedarach TaxID=155640 RepID=A0ACC1YVT3_MELAZ|nr:hypothetical protein OWV82_000676 [Melia azedarach]